MSTFSFPKFKMIMNVQMEYLLNVRRFKIFQLSENAED